MKGRNLILQVVAGKNDMGCFKFVLLNIAAYRT